MHYKTCIPSLIPQPRDLQSENQELQWSHKELSQAAAPVAGISKSYGYLMTQFLSTQERQDVLDRGYQREFKETAASVAHHVKMSNHNTAKCVGAVGALAKSYTTIA